MMRIDELITDEVRCVAIAGHTHPDGDCIGSVMGLAGYLKKNYPDLTVLPYLESVNEKFYFLSGAAEAVTREPADSCDILFILDCGDEGRVGGGREMLSRCAKKICIDHHISNTGFADVNVIEPEISSASELLYTLLDPEKIDFDCAQCLYTGIVHDTGVFKHSNTKRQTMEIAGKLLEFGISSSRIINETFYQKTFAQNRVLGHVLVNAGFWEEEKTVYGILSLEDQERFSVTSADTDGIIDQLKLTAGCEAAVFLYELSDGAKKISMRSDGRINVQLIASSLGGGGHKQAAGATVAMSFEETLAVVRAKIGEQW